VVTSTVGGDSGRHCVDDSGDAGGDSGCNSGSDSGVTVETVTVVVTDCSHPSWCS
jgi:hypothetical protein